MITIVHADPNAVHNGGDAQQLMVEDGIIQNEHGEGRESILFKMYKARYA